MSHATLRCPTLVFIAHFLRDLVKWSVFLPFKKNFGTIYENEHSKKKNTDKLFGRFYFL